MVARCFAGILMLLLLAVLAACDQTKSEAPTRPSGRYQIVFSPHSAQSTFLLDTQTGTVWQETEFTFLKGEPTVWNLTPRIDNDDDYAKVVSQFGKKSPPAPPLTLPPPR